MARQLDRLRSDLHVDGGVVLKDNSYGINVNVDGFQPKDLNVSLKDGLLTITGKHEEKSQDGNRFSSRQFTRSYRLPEHVVTVGLQVARNCLTPSAAPLCFKV